MMMSAPQIFGAMFTGDETEQVLLITDVAGYSKVALSAMLPVLTHLGYDLYNLPTALVSNNFVHQHSGYRQQRQRQPCG